MKDQSKEFFFLTIFAVAFGYIEGAVAHYLRMHYYPGGFSNVIIGMDIKTLFIECGREFATLIVLVSVAGLTGGRLIKIIADFVYIFAIWDIIYYGALYVFEGWPSTFLDWDILFLIPLPWLAPVLAPILISILGIFGALIIRRIYFKNNSLIINRTIVLLLIIALILWLISFLINTPFNFPAERFPVNYNWLLFFSGVSFTTAGFIFIIRNNCSKQHKVHSSKTTGH